VAYLTAKTNAETQVRTAETAIEIQRAALHAAQAALDLKRSGPRSVDVEPLRASVTQASVNYEKALNDLQNTQIIAPVDGIISEVIPDVGEQASPSVIAIKMVGTSQFDIEAQVPEADIAKVMIGQVAEITLDAYGDDVKFKGTVTAKDPAESKIQDAIYYKIRVQIDPAGKEVKPGMTANVTITTADRKNVLVIPLRAVRTKAGTTQKTVRVLVENAPQNRDVSLGLRGDEGRVES
jgi:HlyD family secretion protein